MNARLSSAELTLAPSLEESRREHHGCWLYFHLQHAATLRMRMDRAPCFGDYDNLDRERRQAIARSIEHYRALMNLGGLDALLTQMATTEWLST